MIEHTVVTYGGLDMAFNNAGIVGFTGDPAEESAESFDSCRHQPARYLDVHEARASPDAHPRSGAIVNCSSLGGLVGQAGRAT